MTKWAARFIGTVEAIPLLMVAYLVFPTRAFASLLFLTLFAFVCFGVSIRSWPILFSILFAYLAFLLVIFSSTCCVSPFAIPNFAGIGALFGLMVKNAEEEVTNIDGVSPSLPNEE